MYISVYVTFRYDEILVRASSIPVRPLINLGIESTDDNFKSMLQLPISDPHGPIQSHLSDVSNVLRALEVEFGRAIRLEEVQAYVRMKSILAQASFLSGIDCPTFMEKEIEERQEMEEVQEKYCWCLRVDDGSAMVCCDGCDYWYHAACIK